MSITEIFHDRVGRGYIFEFGRILSEANDRGVGVSDIIRERIVQRGIDRYSDKITAAMRRGGVDVKDGEILTPERLGQIFEEQTGIAAGSIGELTPELVLETIDKEVSERLSEELGFKIDSVFNGDAMQQSLQAGIDAKIEELGGNLDKYLDAATIRNLRRKATWARSGLDARKVQNCLAQRAWREGNRWMYY